MSTIVSTVLITAPPAFLVGWILSKVVFRHLSLTRPNALQREALKSSAPVATENAGSTQLSADGRRVNVLRQKLAGALAESQSLRSEMQLLKEAAAEREHAVLELKRKLKVQLAVPEQSLVAAPAKQQRFVQMLEDRLTTHELHIEELRQELKVAKTGASLTTQRNRKWRQKFKPIAKQFRQQRKMIGELREELRRRDLEQQKLADDKSTIVASGIAVPAQNTAVLALPEQNVPLQASIPSEVVAAEAGSSAELRAGDLSTGSASSPEPDFGDEEREDLQVLRGIGPALHKRLNEKGIYRLRQLALMSPQELNNVGRSLGISGKLLIRHAWSRQARLLLRMPVLQADEKVEA